MRYVMQINTDEYKCARCSKKTGNREHAMTT